MYRNFYSYNDMPRIIRPEQEKTHTSAPAPPIHNKNENKNNCGNNSSNLVENGKLFGKFELDDIILIVVALLLFADDCDDTLLLLAIGFVFISGLL